MFVGRLIKGSSIFQVAVLLCSVEPRVTIPNNFNLSPGFTTRTDSSRIVTVVVDVVNPRETVVL